MTDRAKIFADGGSRGNPGPAGCGAVIIADDRTIAEISEYLGNTTNNVAEYTGLVLALERAKEMSIPNIEVFMDSELVVKQMLGQYKVKHPGLIPLYQKAKALAISFNSFEIGHVRREMNKLADKLANQAMDGAKAL